MRTLNIAINLFLLAATAAFIFYALPTGYARWVAMEDARNV